MKAKTLTILFFSMIALGAYAEVPEPKDNIEMNKEIEKQNNENLINKIETAQKEQFIKFMEKKNQMEII